MTIIACSSTERRMVADTLLTDTTNAHRLGSVSKILRCPDGALAGAAGGTKECWTFLNWASGTRGSPLPGGIFDSDDGVNGLLLLPDGTIQVYYCATPERVLTDTQCVGVGSSVCQAALLAGAGLVRAVSITCEIHRQCGLPLEVLELVAPAQPSRKTRRK